MKTFNNLPILEMGIDEALQDDSGVSFVALVAKPAIQRSFLAFREQQPVRFAVNDDRRIVSGPVLLAETPVYRCPPEVPAPCYMTFSADVIEKTVKKFARLGNHANVNLQHDPGRQVADVVMFESWIKDSTRGTLAMQGYEDAPEGSWFGSWHVNNDEVWQQIKAGEFTGFSIEGLFVPLNDIPAPDPDEALLAQIMELLKK